MNRTQLAKRLSGIEREFFGPDPEESGIWLMWSTGINLGCPGAELSLETARRLFVEWIAAQEFEPDECYDAMWMIRSDYDCRFWHLKPCEWSLQIVRLLYGKPNWHDVTFHFLSLQRLLDLEMAHLELQAGLTPNWDELELTRDLLGLDVRVGESPDPRQRLGA